MASKVAARPNHYQALGLNPTASADEIAKAFARELRQPRTLGGVGLLSVAYQTLRDPAKRRAYDAEIGIGQPSKPQPVLAHRQTARPVAAFAPPSAAPVRAPDAPDAAPPAAPAPTPDTSARPELSSFLAASLRDLARPEPLHETVTSRPPTQQQPRPEPLHETVTSRPPAQQQPRPESAVEAPPPERMIVELTAPQFAEAEKGVIAWKRPALAVGALVGVAGLAGIWAGWESGNDMQAPPQTVAKAFLPPARPLPAGIEQPAAAAPVLAEVQPEPAVAAPVAVAAADSPPSSPQQTTVPAAEPVPEAPETGLAAAEEAPAAPITPAETVAEAAPASRAVALPLPDRTIARTIERIGYACGQVASTSAVDGASGVFKVTCTSGQAYQARPVGGRYHFRRWGRS